VRDLHGDGASLSTVYVPWVKPLAGEGQENKALQVEVSMFRKLMLASVASLGFIAPLAVPTATNAAVYHHWHHHFYRVYYLAPYQPGWIFAGAFREHRVAERVAAQFRWQGFAVSIR
jgi:hypothetical protein